jgi:protease-4
MYFQLDLSGTFYETGAQSGGLLSSLNDTPRFRHDELYTAVTRLAGKNKVETVLVNCELDFDAGMLSGALSIRDQLQRLRDSGKTLIFYARQYGMSELIIASVCQQRVIHPLGSIIHVGMSRTFRFFKNLMDKHDIRAEVIRIGRYKAAGDSFRVSSIDEHNRKQFQAIMDAVVRENEAIIAQGYGKKPDEVAALRDGKIVYARHAVEQGWASREGSLDDLIAEFREAKNKPLKRLKPSMKAGKGTKVAVLVFEGGIKDGHNENSQLSGQMIGSSDYVPVIRSLVKDKSVKAVVFRVNSGGGSAIASEDIARELSRLKAKKPVVVSMGAVAGSGGYWISTQAEKIFAERTSVTGSIGVINIHFNLAEFLASHGITHSTVKTGDFADFASSFRDLTETERKLLMDYIMDLYGMFRQRVSDITGLSVEKVHELGEGHVFAGVDAKEVGLVHELGGLNEVLDWVKGELSAKSLSVQFLPHRKKSLMSRLLGGGGGQVLALCRNSDPAGGSPSNGCGNRTGKQRVLGSDAGFPGFWRRDRRGGLNLAARMPALTRWNHLV